MAEEYRQPKSVRLQDTSLLTDEERAVLEKWPKSFDDPKPKEPIVSLVDLEGEKPQSSILPPTDDNFFDEEKPAKRSSPFAASARTPATAPVSQGKSMSAELVRVVDGDTVVVRLPNGKQVPVRLRGVNAAELSIGSPGAGEAAKAALEERLRSGKLTLSNIAIDQTGGRLQANVSTAGSDAGQWLIDQGKADRPLAEGPKGNEWRGVWSHMPADKLEWARDLAARRQRVGWLQRLGRLNPDTPGYKEFQEEWNGFVEQYYKPYAQKRSLSRPAARAIGGGDPVEQAIDQMIGRRMKEPVPQAQDWQQSSSDSDRPEGKSEWARWEKTLSPKERALWSQLKAAERKYHAEAPPYRLREYQKQPAYQEWRKLYDKFLNLTTKRFRHLQSIAPPQPVRRSHRRRADLGDGLGDESAELLGVA